mgnify:CR=1 FL=1
MKNLQLKLCEYCGINEIKLEGRRFCSHSCAVKYGWETKKLGKGNGFAYEIRNCFLCNKEFGTKVNAKKRFCSNLCACKWKCQNFMNSGMAGKKPWNFGLTKETDLRVLQESITIKKQFLLGERYPRGFVRRSKSGFKKDLSHYTRSNWEANIAKNTFIIDGDNYKELTKIFKDRIEKWE